MKSSVVFACLGTLLLAGCQPSSQQATDTNSKSPDSDATIVSGSTLSEAEKSKLLSAKELLFVQLSSRLMDAMVTNGPIGAIEVCQVEARKIAIDVGREANVSIGRTGVRLRNINNQPPTWAKQLVTDKIDTPAFMKLSNGHTAALLPIKLQAQCLMCHGDRETMMPELKAKLTELYPQDRATGFAEGELRGWFWVESLE